MNEKSQEYSRVRDNLERAKEYDAAIVINGKPCKNCKWPGNPIFCCKCKLVACEDCLAEIIEDTAFKCECGHIIYNDRRRFED